MDNQFSVSVFLYVTGTENAADEDDRREIAVEKETGGSYVVCHCYSKENVILIVYMIHNCNS